jgi:hypothetical protein
VVTGSGAVRFPAVVPLCLLVPPLAACDDDEPAVANVSVQFEAGAPMGTCAAVEQQHAIEGQSHVQECSPIAYGTKPPSSGNHYDAWAAFKVYSNPIPPGYWVHDLEHGAVVLTYNCPDGCDADVAAAVTMLNALAPDPLCLSTATVPRRTIMTPDPNLDVRFAASAWGFTLRANCFDTDVFRSFIDRHYGAGPESVCGGGVDLATGVQPGCGGR